MMKISVDVLRRYTTLPAAPRALRELLDDVGVEVKRINGDQVSLELLANRGDHHCYAGVAREVHGRTGGGVSTPDIAPLQVGEGPVPIRVDTPLGLLYTATLLERDADAPEQSLPEEVLAPLVAAEIKPLLPPVDATNLSNLELGQPTHVFDADKVVGTISVRLSRAGETAWPLFTEGHVPLAEGTLVIADDTKILAIAGVIGCEDSKTTDRTSRIILESAAFDPISVRKARRGLNIHTDAAARFERGSDPSAPLHGAGRVVYLLERFAGWRRIGNTTVAGEWVDPGRHIRLNVSAANTFLDTRMAADEVAMRLERYGFSITLRDQGDFVVKVPPHRLWDVEFAADLYEELAKSIGYNSTPQSIPPVGMGALPSAAEQAWERTEEVLLGQGFYEVITDGFYSRELRARLGAGQEDHPLFAHVQTLNSLERGYSLLKNNALGQALEAADKNLRVRHTNIKMYEWTRTFRPTGEGEAPDERPLLWLLVSGQARPRTWSEGPQPADPIYLKGVLAEIATELSLSLTLRTASGEDPLSGCLHPNRQAEIWMDGRRVGILGEVHPSVIEAFRIKRARPCYLELDRAALASAGARPAYTEPPPHQPIVRSLAFALPAEVTAGQVAAVLHDSGPEWLEKVNMTDLFAFEQDGRPLRAVTYELVYANAEGSRTAEAVNERTEALVSAVHDAFAADGVYQRT
jgi:phenylalanyl-tRNA synthetase beta chain